MHSCYFAIEYWWYENLANRGELEGSRIYESECFIYQRGWKGSVTVSIAIHKGTK